MPLARLLLFALLSCSAASAQVQLYCHRTANEDVPENTLESLDLAARMGCNVVEIDVRKTLEGVLILNHDGVLDRLTDGTGAVASSFYADLAARDAGSWMGPRFRGLHIARFEDALRLARARKIDLILDIKQPDEATEVLTALRQENMLDHARFGGEWQQIKRLYPEAHDESENHTWVQPGVTAEEVQHAHAQGRYVIANFSANDHTMDLAGMRAAVAAGVDAINVDYPRLGADAIGRPIEHHLHDLILQANSGDPTSRLQAILELSHFWGFPLLSHFNRWLLDTDPTVSRAAAVALLTFRPTPAESTLAPALHATTPHVRANAAWLIGARAGNSASLLPLLHETDPTVLTAALHALTHTQGSIPAATLLKLLSHPDADVRGAAAVALARFAPSQAVPAIRRQLQRELATDHELRRTIPGPTYTPAQIDAIMRQFRCQIQMVHALNAIPNNESAHALADLAFAPSQGYSQNGFVAAFDLWDRWRQAEAQILAALNSTDRTASDRAEWLLTHTSGSLTPLRRQLNNPDPQLREKAERILAWQGDTASLPRLEQLSHGNASDAPTARWAIDTIHALAP